MQRFVSEDPIGFYGHDFNQYIYVGGSPTNWIDPLGLSKGGKQNYRDTGLAPYSDEELDKMYKDPNTSNEMKQRIKREQKARKQRNKQKRNNKINSCDTCERAAEVVVISGVAYVVYRCVRLIPSLFPPLWPTLPANLATP